MRDFRLRKFRVQKPIVQSDFLSYLGYLITEVRIVTTSLILLSSFNIQGKVILYIHIGLAEAL